MMEKYLNKAKSKLNKLVDELKDSSYNSHGIAVHTAGHSKHEHKHQHEQQTQIPIAAREDQPSAVQPPTPLDVLRYRYHHGCNLGAVYVLEKWLFPSMFPEGCPDDKKSELAAVEASVKAVGIEETRRNFEEHWENALTDEDLDWLVEVAHCTSIRLPIGYFTLGPQFSENTPFAPYADVYQNCWASVKQLTQRARARGIGTLIDFHGLPGGANKCDHSGTDSGEAEHWCSTHCRNLSQRCLEFIAREIRDSCHCSNSHKSCGGGNEVEEDGGGIGDGVHGGKGLGFGDGVVGLQICNEAEWEAQGLYEWYDAVVAAIHALDNSIPVYVSDAWNLDKCAAWCARRNGVFVGAAPAPVVVDTHLYWAFSEQDKRKSPRAIAAEARAKLAQLDEHEGDVLRKGAVAAVVGEYSCVLTEESWERRGSEERDDLVRLFGQAQCERYQKRALGSFFWTYKMNWMPGGEWGFKSCTTRAAITCPWPSTLSISDVEARLTQAQEARSARLQAASAAHRKFWDAQQQAEEAADMALEHWRYDAGWELGYADAAAFFGMRASEAFGAVEAIGGAAAIGGDKIGSAELWVRRRVLESGMGGACVWEFEQGLRKGVADFWDAAGGL